MMLATMMLLAALPAPDRPWLADADRMIPTPYVRLGRAGILELARVRAQWPYVTPEITWIDYWIDGSHERRPVFAWHFHVPGVTYIEFPGPLNSRPIVYRCGHDHRWVLAQYGNGDVYHTCTGCQHAWILRRCPPFDVMGDERCWMPEGDGEPDPDQQEEPPCECDGKLDLNDFAWWQRTHPERMPEVIEAMRAKR